MIISVDGQHFDKLSQTGFPMISAEQNQRLTQVGPGTAGGRLLRNYWHPVALTEELDAVDNGVSRPVIPVRLLGQDLVLFRDGTGQLGLLDRDCPHRGADLSYGRLEDGGLRCSFHGWLFDRNGRCLETPAEPVGSRLCERIRQRAYPVVESNGAVFAWLGEAKPAPLPPLDCFTAPGTHVFAFKGLWRCNWLQAQEVGIDPAHASFLHRFYDDGDPQDSYGKQFRAASANSGMAMTQVLRQYDRPEIQLTNRPFGLQLTTLRRLGEHQTHVRVTNGIFPNGIVLPMSETMTLSQWHVPIDDTQTYWFALFTSFTEAIDKQAMRAQRLAMHQLPDYAPLTSAENRYGFNAADQKNRTYTGMGEDINVHDQWAVESPGAIADRTREHLGTTDKAIMANRRLLLSAMQAVEQGEQPPGFMGVGLMDAESCPVTMDGVCDSDDPTTIAEFVAAIDRQRRDKAYWLAAG